MCSDIAYPLSVDPMFDKMLRHVIVDILETQPVANGIGRLLVLRASAL
jgi:hypothetical protein